MRNLTVNFRIARDEDVDVLVELARDAHQESRFAYIEFSPDKVIKIAKRALKSPDRHGLMLAFREDQPAGFVYCTIGEYHIGCKTLVTTIHNINVMKSMRGSLGGGRIALGLFKGVESWSQARGAQEILFHVTSGVSLASSHKLAKRMGYKFIGGSYALPLRQE